MLSINGVEQIVLAELSVYDPAIPGSRTLYYTTSVAYITRPAETPANTVFQPRITQVPSMRRDLFGELTTYGPSTVGYGDLVLNNQDGALDGLQAYGFAGRSITLRIGPVDAAYPSGFTTLLVGSMEQPIVDVGTVTISLRDLQAVLDRPLQTVKYAGTNTLPAGLEGVPTDLMDRPKPLLFGTVFNVPVPCVNTSKLIYQIAHNFDASGATVNAVYDRGMPLTWTGTTYANATDLQNDTLAPAPGYFTPLFSAGGIYIRIGLAPSGALTADASQGANVSHRTAAQLFTQILQQLGYTSGAWSASDVTALDALNAAECGIWIADETRGTNALDEILGSVGAWWGADRLGVFRCRRFDAPSGSPVFAFTEDDLDAPGGGGGSGGGHTAIARRQSNDGTRGIPNYACKVQYAKNYTVQAADFVDPALEVRVRVLSTTSTAVVVRVAVADPFPQGTGTGTIAYQDLGSGGVTPASGGTVTPAATLSEAAGSFVDYTITLPAFGAPARVTFTAGAANRQSASDSVDTPYSGAAKAISYSATPPASPAINDLWLDTSVSPNVWKRWSGTQWVPATSTSASDISETTDRKWSAQVAATGDGFQILSNPDFLGGSLAGYGVYDNSGSGFVTHTAEADNTAPNSSGYRLKIAVTAGTYNTFPSPGPVPGWGGFYRGIGPDGGAFAQDTYHRGTTILWRVRAKIPVGYNLQWAQNDSGDQNVTTWLTSQAGTGDWFDYVLKQVIGTTSAVHAFSTIGFFWLDDPGTFVKPTWYVAVCSAMCISLPAGVAIQSVDANRRPLIDLASGHVNKSVDFISDGSTYARVLLSELSSGQVVQIRDAVESLTFRTNQARREAIMWATVI